jgi:alpha-tubulin suppressor-like RCC1 family protein
MRTRLFGLVLGVLGAVPLGCGDDGGSTSGAGGASTSSSSAVSTTGAAPGPVSVSVSGSGGDPSGTSSSGDGGRSTSGDGGGATSGEGGAGGDTTGSGGEGGVTSAGGDGGAGGVSTSVTGSAGGEGGADVSSGGMGSSTATTTDAAATVGSTAGATTTTGGTGGSDPGDLAPPELFVDGPALGSLLRTARYAVDIAASDDVALARVGYVLNGGDEIDLDGADGLVDFAGALDLRPTRGENVLVVFAVDQVGNRTEVVLDARFERSTSAGASHTGAVRDGELYVWGRNNLGQLGLAVGDTATRELPILNPNLSDVTQFDLRQTQSLAVTLDGTLWTWGNNADGRLGLGAPGVPDIANRPVPNAVSSLPPVLAAGFGFSHTLVILEDGTVRTFGDNTAGQLGDGTTTDSHFPVEVPGLTDVIQVTGGTAHSVALLRDGTVWTWGGNSNGVLGNGPPDAAPHPVPTQVAGLTDVVQIASGRYHVVALRADGSVVGWGLNQSGQVGNGESGDADVYTPTPVLNLEDAIGVYADANLSFAIREGNIAVGWGQNFNGHLGLGGDDTTDRAFPETPVAVAGLEHVEPGATHCAAMTTSGDVYTWGFNTFSTLGRPGLLNTWPYPTPGLVVLP